jgi:hypothetical protein
MSVPPVLIDTLAATPDALERVCAMFTVDTLRSSPDNWEGSPGEHFAAIGQVCHVRDIETDGYHVRFRRIRDERAPDLESLDGYALAAARGYDVADLAHALRAFRNARAITIDMLRSLSPDELQRTATFAENGTVTMLGLIHLLCSHDQQHLATLHWLLSRIHD